MTIDKHTLDRAKKWAGEILDRVRPHQYADTAIAAAEVVRDLPEEIVDGDKVLELLDKWAANPFPTSNEVAVLNDVEALLPAPKPRTLAEHVADMGDHNEFCWCQAKLKDDGKVQDVVIIRARPASSVVMNRAGFTYERSNQQIIPLPDLPRMVWPDDQFSDLPEAAQETLKASVEDYKARRFVDIDSDQGSNCQGTLNSLPEPQPGEAWLVDCHADGTTEALYTGGSEYPWVFVDPDEPNERRWIYKSAVPLRRLVPAQEPRVLTAVEDYENAAVGTIAQRDNGITREKVGADEWGVAGAIKLRSNEEMALRPRTVLWEPK